MEKGGIYAIIEGYAKKVELACGKGEEFFAYMNTTHSDWIESIDEIYSLHQSKLDKIRKKCFGAGYAILADSKDAINEVQKNTISEHSPSMAIGKNRSAPRFDYNPEDIKDLYDVIEQLRNKSYEGESFKYYYDDRAFSKDTSSWNMAMEGSYGEFFATTKPERIGKKTKKMKETEIKGSIEYEYLTAINVKPSSYWYAPEIFKFLGSYNVTGEYKSCTDTSDLFTLIPDILYIGVNPSIKLSSSKWSSIYERLSNNTEIVFHIGPFSFSLDDVNREDSNYRFESSKEGFSITLEDYIPKLVAYHGSPIDCNDYGIVADY